MDSIIKHNGVLAEHTIKKSLDNYCLNVSMETIFIIRENNETNEPNIFVLKLPQRLGLRSSIKHVALQNLSIYFTCKNIRQQYKKTSK